LEGEGEVAFLIQNGYKKKYKKELSDILLPELFIKKW